LIIPTDGGLRPWMEKWRPMTKWLRANGFKIHFVPCDALIEIRDGTCLGVEVFITDATGRLVWDDADGRPPTRVEWHPMVQPPPPELLPAEDPS
jgi:hypothetical protein